MKRSTIIILVLLFCILIIASCAAGPNTAMDIPNADGKVAGFLMGLWHGFIAPFTFIISLFTDNVSLYEIHNNGGWYDFGFVIGACIIFSGGGRASKPCKTKV